MASCCRSCLPPPIMEGIDGVSMNIINDDRTPVRAIAAAQGVNVARASVQLPDSNHCQTGLNSSVARDYQLFTTESFVKRGDWKHSFKHLERIFHSVFHPKLLFLICWENSRHQRANTDR